jgi:CheY-like chemotaxis protein
VVLETSLDDQQREYLGIVKSSSAHLLGLLNDVLDISKIEAGKVELELAPFRLRASLGQTIATQAQRARDKGLELLYQVLPEVPDALVGDFGRIRQVLLNLISNAVKFTEAGEVRVQVGLAGLAGLNQRLDQDAELLLVVTDTGVGVPPEKVRDIFEPFSQADASTSRKYGGTGLGLAICRQLVQMMGGEMWVDSRPGVGSTFSFTLRVGLDFNPEAEAVPPPAAEAAPGPSPATGLKILLAEDNLVNQRLATIVLQRRGHQVTVAANGREALAALARDGFDLVLMDVEMPEMDGYDATRAIRQREAAGDGRRTPIIAMTAHAMAEDRARCLAAGMDDYLTKPIEPERLYALVETWGRPGR